MKRFVKYLGPLIGLSLFCIALWVLHRELQEYHLHDILESIRSLPVTHIFLAFGLTLLNYLALTGYDTLAFRYIRHSLRYRKIALASFLGYAFSNNMGLSMVAGSSVRYRLYSAWGLSTLDITRVVAFYTVTLWLGLCAVGGLLLLMEPLPFPPRIPFLSTVSARPLGVLLLLVLCAYLLGSLLRKKPLSILGWEFPLPPLRLSLFQITVSSLDWILAGSVLYVLLPRSVHISFAIFVTAYMLGQIAGLVSQIPGGLGVFESVVVMLLPVEVPTAPLVASLLAYRGIYYLLPLGLASVLLGTYEILERRKRFKQWLGVFGRWIPGLAPRLLAFSTFVTGVILSFSGAAPAVGHRLAWLRDLLPLPVLEVSHFLGSLIGLGLLLLSRALQKRLDAAYHLTALLLGAGMLTSALQGFRVEEILLLGVMLAALLPCRKFFYRKASLLNERFSPQWALAVALVLVASLWLGMFAHKHVDYSHDLWWSFTLEGDAPRFLRAMVGTAIAALAFAVARLLKPAPPPVLPPSSEERERVRAIVAESPDSAAHLALLGDKAFLFSESGSGFIMYAVAGRCWVAMGDPIGPEEERSELLWKFRELCDQHDAWQVHYEVGTENLSLYLDLGLTLLKMGEKARVPLENFSLDGNSRRGLRYTRNRLEKEGCDFEIVPPEVVPSLLEELRAVSDAWLTEKKTREKSFSLGFFRPEYLRGCPAGLIRRDGRILAFANLWLGAGKEEFSVDLMRYLPDAPDNVMEYLFVRLMLWGREQGYRSFNLGMAPLSGLERHELAPLWTRLGSFIFRHGENFYKFQGLRQYKGKFGAVWEPKYLAIPANLLLPRILTNVAALISGGVKGMVGK
jgi:phosphatidylglycerol lysyltransferase